MKFVHKFLDGFLFALILMAIGLPISAGLVFASNAAAAAFGVLGGVSAFLIGIAVMVGAAAAVFDHH